MNILVVAPDFYPTNGGYANAINNFVSSLANESGGKMQIVIFTRIPLGLSAEIQLPNVTVVRFSMNNFLIAFKVWEIVSFFKIRTILKKQHTDVIFFETAEFGLLGYLTTALFKRVLVRIHACTETEVAMWGDRVYDRVHSFFIKIFLRKVKWVLSTNRYHVEFYKKFFLKENIYKIAKKTFFIVPNIVPSVADMEQKEEEKSDLLERYGITLQSNQRIFFSLGRLNAVGLIQKGFEDFIYATHLIKTEDAHILGDMKVVLVGDGEFTPSILKLIESLNLCDTFHIIPKMNHDDVMGFMKISTSVVLLSRFEGLSMFALEALSSGAPLIFSKTGGLSDLVSLDNGFLVPPQDIESIKNALVFMATAEESVIDRMRLASKKHFSENFNSSTTIRKFIGVINLISK